MDKMFNKIGRIGRDVAASSLAIMETTATRDYLLMTAAEREKYLKDKATAHRLNKDASEHPKFPRYNGSEEESEPEGKETGTRQHTIERTNGRDSRASSPSEETLRPTDVIHWITPFDGTGNVRVFIREVDDALEEMSSWRHEKDLLRRVIASKLVGQVKDLVNTQGTNTWGKIKELLENYFEIRDAPYTYLKEQRNKIIQGPGEDVQTYARRFLDAHSSVMRAAGNKADTRRAKYAQELEEEEGVWRFIVGLVDRLNERVEARSPRSLKEAINVALNVESQLKERYLCRRLAQLRVEEKGRRREDPRYKEERRIDEPRYRGERRHEESRYRDERRRYDDSHHRDDFRPRSDKNRGRSEDTARAGRSSARKTCFACRAPGHYESECPQRQTFEKQDFRTHREQGRPPPIRALEEEEAEENNSDPYEYSPPETADKSSISDQEESTEWFVY